MSRPITDGLGLAELRRRSAPGECALCGEPARPRADNDESRRKRATHTYVTCGAPECVTAYHRLYGRDRRRRARNQREAVNA